jgi:Family of unknown function (DUF5678)
MSTTPAKKPVYLRGIPSDVVREAKAAAAKRGVTLAGFVADTLARALRDPMPVAKDPADDLSKEMRWYERNRDRLLREFGGEYIAVLDNAVIDHDADFEALAERVFAKHGARNLFMPRVSKIKLTLRVRSPRVQSAAQGAVQHAAQRAR